MQGSAACSGGNASLRARPDHRRSFAGLGRPDLRLPLGVDEGLSYFQRMLDGAIAVWQRTVGLTLTVDPPIALALNDDEQPRPHEQEIGLDSVQPCKLSVICVHQMFDGSLGEWPWLAARDVIAGAAALTRTPESRLGPSGCAQGPGRADCPNFGIGRNDIVSKFTDNRPIRLQSLSWGQVSGRARLRIGSPLTSRSTATVLYRLGETGRWRLTNDELHRAKALSQGPSSPSTADKRQSPALFENYQRRGRGSVWYRHLGFRRTSPCGFLVAAISSAASSGTRKGSSE